MGILSLRGGLIARLIRSFGSFSWDRRILLCSIRFGGRHYQNSFDNYQQKGKSTKNLKPIQQGHLTNVLKVKNQRRKTNLLIQIESKKIFFYQLTLDFSLTRSKQQDLIINTRVSHISSKKQMEKQPCMGCRTAFQDNQRTILQNLTTEYKNYQLPLKDDRIKWALLKAIVSFLNSQGGTIYLGIEDNEGAVQGQLLTRKEQDSFKLFMKQLLERVHPKIDLNNRQEVVIQFVPVLRKKEFQGKYIVKIIVQQGDPHHLYYFGEKIKLEGPTGKVDEIEYFYAYERHNMGGTTEIKGIKLMDAIYERAKNPNNIAVPTHEGCNPQPPHLELQIRKIYFTNILLEHFSVLQGTLEMYFNSIEYQTSYDEVQKAMSMEFDDQNDLKVAEEFIQASVQEWNKDIFKDHNLFLEIKGEKTNYFLIQNNPKMKSPKKEDRSNKKQQIAPHENKKIPYFPHKQKKETQIFHQIPIQMNRKGIPSHFPKKHALTITHINQFSSKQLEAYLLNSIYKKMQKYAIRYINTIELFFGSEGDMVKYYTAIGKNYDAISSFGNKGEIWIGINTGRLRIQNYDKNRMDEMVEMLQKFMKEDLREAELVKQNNKFSILLKMKDRPTTCLWLDNILQGKYLWEFSYKQHSRGKKILVLIDLL